VRKLIVEGWGLCQYHSWLMARLAVEDPSLGGGLGPAIIMEDLLHRFREAMKSGTLPKTGGGCYVCKQVRDFEKMYVESMARRIESTDLLDKYEASKSSILCSKHFAEVRNLLREDLCEKLTSIQMRKLEALERTIRSYIDKHDYRCREPITREEAESWLLAIEALVGNRALLSGLYRRV